MDEPAWQTRLCMVFNALRIEAASRLADIADSRTRRQPGNALKMDLSTAHTIHISTTYLYHMNHLNQEQVQALYEELLDKIGAKYHPISVVVQPDSGAKLNNCFNNVAKKVKNEGGEIVFGWALLPQRHILEAEKHAIWKSPDEQYIDITPRPFPIPKLQFVIDDEFKYEGQLIGNVRLNVTGNRVVDDWIVLAEAIDELYSYSTRVNDEQVSMPPVIAPLLKQMEKVVKYYEPFVSNGGTAESSCFCGKPLPYKDCHGSELQTDIAEDLAQIEKLMS